MGKPTLLTSSVRVARSFQQDLPPLSRTLLTALVVLSYNVCIVPAPGDGKPRTLAIKKEYDPDEVVAHLMMRARDRDLDEKPSREESLDAPAAETETS